MTAIWKKPFSLDALRAAARNTAIEHLGIEYLEIGDDYLVGRVPVDHRTHQPYGLLHGGVSVVLAETLGSVGAMFSSSGWVTGTARPVHIGRTTQVWQIDMVNDEGKLTCVSRITMAMLQEG